MRLTFQLWSKLRIGIGVGRVLPTRKVRTVHGKVNFYNGNGNNGGLNYSKHIGCYVRAVRGGQESLVISPASRAVAKDATITFSLIIRVLNLHFN